MKRSSIHLLAEFISENLDSGECVELIKMIDDYLGGYIFLENLRDYVKQAEKDLII